MREVYLHVTIHLHGMVFSQGPSLSLQTKHI